MAKRREFLIECRHPEETHQRWVDQGRIPADRRPNPWRIMRKYATAELRDKVLAEFQSRFPPGKSWEYRAKGLR